MLHCTLSVWGNIPPKILNRKSRCYSQALQWAAAAYGEPMEKYWDSNLTLRETSAHALAQLDAAGLSELLCAVTLPLIALLIGIRLNRWIDSRPRDNIHAHIVDFIAPLLGPALATLFLALAEAVFHMWAIDTFILPFMIKLAFAWLAITIVVLMSSRQSAGWLIALVIIPITLLHLFGLWDPVTDALADMKFTIGKSKLNAFGVLKSIGALIALFWVAGFIVRATDARLRRVRGVHVSNRVLIMKFFQIFIYFLVLMLGLQMLGVDLTAFSVLGGALGVGIGFGLQKIASNFISGIILLFEKSVSVDDMIELSDGTIGFIRQTAGRYTLLETADGREILIPNEEFITQRVTTLTHSHRRARAEILVGVAYDSDMDLVRQTMLDAAHACPDVADTPEPTCYMTAFGDSAIQMVLYFWVDNVADGRLRPRHEVMRNILLAFREKNIVIPYPHQVQIADPALEQRFADMETRLHGVAAEGKDALHKPAKKAKDS